MRGISKKMLISIFTSIIVMITIVATTFAWVGIFTYASTDNFKINLKTQDLDINYFLTISSSGMKNSFSDTVNISDIHRQILKNKYKDSDRYDEYSMYIDSLDDEEIDNLFVGNSKLIPSTSYFEDDELKFKSINLKRSEYFEYINQKNQFINFDLYLSVGAREGIQDTTNFDLSVYLTDLENTLIGSLGDYKFYNRNPFSHLPSANEILLSLPDTTSFKLDSKNAVRFAISIFEPVLIDNNDTKDDVPLKTVIYHGGEKNPTISNDVYDLGGNLPEDSNTALKELLVLRPDYKNGMYTNRNRDFEDALQYAIESGSTNLSLTENNSKLWTKPESTIISYEDGKTKYNYLGVKDGIQTKMKLSVYFWFEGWDADCLSGINEKPVALNLTFTAGVES